jgi:hypothetical protein
MLTEQVRLFGYVPLSAIAWDGMVGGAIIGLLITIAVLLLQRRLLCNQAGLVGVLYGVVPGAITAALALPSLYALHWCLARQFGTHGFIGEFERGLPKPWEGLAESLTISIPLFAAGIAARCAIPDASARPLSRSEIAKRAKGWAVVGLLFGIVSDFSIWCYFCSDNILGCNRTILGLLRVVEMPILLASGFFLWRWFLGLASLSGSPEPTLHAADSKTVQASRWKLLLPPALLLWLSMISKGVFAPITIAIVLAGLVWGAMLLLGRYRARLAWLAFSALCFVQAILMTILPTKLFSIRFSIQSYWDLLGDDWAILTLVMSGPVVQFAERNGWRESSSFHSSPTTFVSTLLGVVLLQVGLVWLVGDRLLIRRDSATQQHRLAWLVLATLLFYGIVYYTFAKSPFI